MKLIKYSGFNLHYYFFRAMNRIALLSKQKHLPGKYTFIEG
jgi:hypothetical protein